MAKFHVNPTTLEPGRCRANKSCPFGDESVHFPTLEEARESAEKRLGEVMNTFNSKGDFTNGEVVILGGFYDTPGREATVIEVEKDSVKLKSYDDGETYWVTKEFITDPSSEQYVSRKDSTGNYVSQEKAYVSRAVQHSWELISGFKSLSVEQRKELDELWSNDPYDSEGVRGEAYEVARKEKRAQLVANAWEANRGEGNDSSYFGAREAVDNAILAEIVQDKISKEDYFVLTHPVLNSSSDLKKIID